jgi:phosphoribosylanthranilate isomerase
MALKTFIKVSNISNLSDARYCAGMGVEMLGFAVEQDAEHYITPQAYQEMIGWLSGVEFVAEFTNAHLEDMNEILEQYPSHALQTENEAVLAKLLQNKQAQEVDSLPIKILFRTQDLLTLQKAAEKYASVVSFFILTEAPKYLPETIESLAQKYPILLEGVSNLVEVEEFLQKTAVKGFVLQGSKEIAPGLKDFDELAEVLEGLEIE